MSSAIYQITNVTTSKIYIGSAIDVAERWYRHIRDLNNGVHCNQYLQRSWNKYHQPAFIFSILENVEDTSMLLKREQYWLDEKKAYEKEHGYNICRVAGSTLGFKMSPESIEKRFTPEYMEHLKERYKGTGNNMAKLDEDNVRHIKTMLMDGLSHSKIAELMGVARSNIGQIANGNTWAYIHVEGWEPVIKVSKKLTEDNVREIRKLLSTGLSQASIARQFGVGKTIIGDIKTGKKWKSVI